MEMLDVANSAEWRSWLRKNHRTSEEVWLVFHKGGEPSISYDDALDEALACGWVDSLIRKIDDRRYARKFTSRRPWSIWSKLNLDRVDRLRREGRITRWGLEAYEKRTSEISQAEKVARDGIEAPDDFLEALKANKKAWTNFDKFTPSYRRRYLMWISAAKRPETRKKRIDEAIVLISRNVKALLK